MQHHHRILAKFNVDICMLKSYSHVVFVVCNRLFFAIERFLLKSFEKFEGIFIFSFVSSTFINITENIFTKKKRNVIEKVLDIHVLILFLDYFLH